MEGVLKPLNDPNFSPLFSSSTLYRIQFYLNYITRTLISLISEGIMMGQGSPSNHEVDWENDEAREGEDQSFSKKISSVLSSFFFLSRLNSDWIEEQRGALMIAATVLMTISFQGVPAMATYTGDGFIYLMTLLTICFSSSVTVAFILVSGVPMTNRICLSMMTLGLCISLYSLFLAFAGFLYKITPESVYATASYGFVLAPLYLLVALTTAVFIYTLIRAVAWIASSCQKNFR